MFELFSKFRQKLLIVTLGLSVFLFSGSLYFSMAQDDSAVDETSQLFLPVVLNDASRDSSSEQLSPNDHGHIISHRFDRFTQYGGTWPPQPKNIENVVWFTDEEKELSAASKKLSSATEISAASAAVQAALGLRFTHIGTVSHSAKGESNTQEIVTYFSHSNNATVEVTMADGAILEVNNIPPTEYQPPLTAPEIDEAVDIARDYWNTSGYERVNELEGFGILGLTPNGATGFNEVRVVYVSFHTDADARPEYVGYVDLTNQVMLESWEE